MIPAVLPPPRADRATRPVSTEEQARFDDALRRAVDPQRPDGDRPAEDVTEDISEDERHATADCEVASGTEHRPRSADGDREDDRPAPTDESATPTAPVIAPAIAPDPDRTERAAAADGTATGSVPSAPTSASAGAGGVVPDGTGEHEPDPGTDLDVAPGTEGGDDGDGNVMAEDVPSVEGVSDHAADDGSIEIAPTDGETTDAGAARDADIVEGVDAAEVEPRAGDRADGGTRVGRGTDASARTPPPVEPVHLAAPDPGRPGDAPSAAPAATPATPTTASAPTTTAPSTGVHPPVAQQVVDHVTPLLDGPDGRHELTIELRPAELGRVQLEVTLDDGVLHVRVTADDAGSRRLLAHAMDDLRALLGEAGITAGDLDVGDPRGGDGSEDEGHDRSSGRGTGPSTTSTDATTRPRAPIDGRAALDVLL